jgi:hypothetical protein
MPFMLPFSPDTVRWRRAAIVDLRKLGIDVWHLTAGRSWSGCAPRYRERSIVEMLARTAKAD